MLTNNHLQFGTIPKSEIIYKKNRNSKHFYFFKFLHFKMPSLTSTHFTQDMLWKAKAITKLLNYYIHANTTGRFHVIILFRSTPGPWIITKMPSSLQCCLTFCVWEKHNIKQTLFLSEVTTARRYLSYHTPCADTLQTQ